MIRAMVCKGSERVVGGIELLETWKQDPESWLWLDLEAEDLQQERELLQSEFMVDELPIIEAQRVRHPPSIDIYPDYLYVLIRPLTAGSDDLEFTTLQLGLFVGKRFIVTRHAVPSNYLNILWDRQLANLLDDTSPLFILSALCRRLTERYGKILLNIEQRLDEIEDILFTDSTDKLMQELVQYNTSLRKMRRVISYQVNVFNTLQHHFATHKDKKCRAEFHDIYSVMERFNSLSELYQNVITDLIDGYISLNGHHLNQIMKVLTIVTVVFVPLSLLTGIYGMNFEYIPELKISYGYFVLLGVMATVVTTLLVWFKRMKWL